MSALPRVNAGTGLGRAARRLDPGFRTVRTGAYDGQFYWGIAIDPFATGTLHRAFDKPSYRYGHPLYGWLAWLVSAGRGRLVPAALIVIGVLAITGGACAAALLGLARGRSGWEGLFVALNPGLASAAGHDLAEPVAASLLLTALLALTQRRRRVAWLLLALLPLAKEPLAAATIAVVCYELVARRTRSALIYLCALLPAVGWWTYARLRLGAWFTTGDSALGEPFLGWWKALDGTAGNAHGLLAPTNDIRVIGVAILAALLVLFALGAMSALRHLGALELSYLGLVGVAVCLAANATAAFSTALRNTAFLLALVPFALAAPLLRERQRGSRRTFRRHRVAAAEPD